MKLMRRAPASGHLLSLTVGRLEAAHLRHGSLAKPVIEKILTHLGLQVCASPQGPARCQALQAARGRPPGTVQATQHSGPVESAATAGLRDLWK